jgi:hypothetical protein
METIQKHISVDTRVIPLSENFNVQLKEIVFWKCVPKYPKESVNFIFTFSPSHLTTSPAATLFRILKEVYILLPL